MCQHSTETGELTGVEAQMVAARADHRRVLELFDGAERGAVNTRMVNLVLSAELELGTDADTAAVRMLQRCTAHGLEPTAALHNNVLGAMSRSSPPEVVISWIRRMAESGVRLDALACNMQLKAYLAMGDQAKAMSLLSAMMNTTDDALPKPDVVSFNTVITYLAHAAKPSQAEAVLTTMLDGASCTADVHSFTAVINAFARASEPAAAAKWLQRMLESPSVVPDAAAFNATLSAYANAGDADGAARVFAAFEAHAMDNCPNAKPDHVSCAAAPPSPLAAPRPALLSTAPLSLPSSPPTLPAIPQVQHADPRVRQGGAPRRRRGRLRPHAVEGDQRRRSLLFVGGILARQGGRAGGGAAVARPDGGGGDRARRRRV